MKSLTKRKTVNAYNRLKKLVGTLNKRKRQRVYLRKDLFK